ncbi:MAG: hypothetical protein JW774_10300 [Candidatus Aureabacteria bacterium]|nr:hypothetical protein [Candidatus Auribacterota bacterium]
MNSYQINGLSFKNVCVVSPSEKKKNEETIQHFLESDIGKHFLGLREKAVYEKAFSEGLKQGWQQRSNEVLTLISSLQSALQQIKGVQYELIRQLEPQVVELAISAAKKIIERELTSGTADLSAVIKQALKNIPASVGIKIKVHPDDSVQLDEFKEEWNKNQPNDQVEIVKESAITKGGCYIETRLGMIDASLETRWEELQKSIRENNGGDAH